MPVKSLPPTSNRNQKDYHTDAEPQQEEDEPVGIQAQLPAERCPEQFRAPEQQAGHDAERQRRRTGDADPKGGFTECPAAGPANYTVFRYFVYVLANSEYFLMLNANSVQSARLLRSNYEKLEKSATSLKEQTKLLAEKADVGGKDLTGRKPRPASSLRSPRKRPGPP